MARRHRAVLMLGLGLLALTSGAAYLPEAAARGLVATERSVVEDVRLSGAGATFPESLYKRWVVEFQKASPHVQVDYRAIGSSGGIRALTDKTAAFAGSDAPLTKKDMEGFGGEGKVIELPMVAGGLVPAYNVPGVEKPLNFTGAVLADIYLGKITNWNDPRLAELNPGVGLPDLAITPAYRSEGSGTTFVFTSYLCTQSPEFKDAVGSGKQVSWPRGQGGQGNPNVAAIVAQTRGAIGYVEQNYATMNKIAFGAVKNAHGEFVLASPERVAKATASAFDKPREDGRLIANVWNAPDAGAYPISALTYIMVYSDLGNLKSRDEAAGLVQYLRWCLNEGQSSASTLDYAPLAEGARRKVLAVLDTVTFKGESLSGAGK